MPRNAPNNFKMTSDHQERVTRLGVHYCRQASGVAVGCSACLASESYAGMDPTCLVHDLIAFQTNPVWEFHHALPLIVTVVSGILCE